MKQVSNDNKPPQVDDTGIDLSDKVNAYISYYMNDDMSVIFDTLGIDMPTELEGDEYEEIMDEARERAERLFTLNPEMMVDRYGEPFNFSKINRAKKGTRQSLG